MPNDRPYYVACNKHFCYVRGLPAAYAKLAEYIGGTIEEVRERRRRHNCPGLIIRVRESEARAAGIWARGGVRLPNMGEPNAQ